MSKVIGIDIGGTKTIHLVLSNGHFGKATTHITPRSKQDFFHLMENLLSFAREANIKKIGIGIAGKVHKTHYVSGPNLKYLGTINFAQMFRGCNVKVINDAEAWALAESQLGAGSAYANVLMLTIGTGIGRALCNQGKTTKKILFKPYEKWEKQYQQIRDKKKWDNLCQFLGEKLAPIIQRVGPNVVILSGGVLKAQSGKFYINLKKALTASGCHIPIKKARFKDAGAAVGATLLFG